MGTMVELLWVVGRRELHLGVQVLGRKSSLALDRR
jgi:hypothetical protein